MKVVAIIPIKKKSERVRSKNFRKINNIELYKIICEKVKKSDFDEVYIDTDSKKVKEYAIKNNFNIINRLDYLSKNDANGNDLLNYHLKIIKSDLYFQIFVTAPLMSVKTINACIKVLKTKKKYDSICTVNKLYTWFWFDNKPINYKPRLLARSQDAKPIIKETTGIYGIRKEALKKYKCRIGKKPFFFEVPQEESIDVDNNFDLKILKLYAKKYLSSSKYKRT